MSRVTRSARSTHFLWLGSYSELKFHTRESDLFNGPTEFLNEKVTTLVIPLRLAKGLNLLGQYTRKGTNEGRR